MSARSTRRNFLQTTAALAGTAAAITIVPRHVLGGPRQIPPSEKMNIAGIGIGGMGAANLANLAGREYRRPVRRRPATTPPRRSRSIPQAKIYTDYRLMLDKQKDIDGVVVGHARPYACRDLHGGHQGRQARLLPETA